MKSTQKDYTRYRIERAWKTFEDAKSLAELKSWNSSMNRLYYACFYAVLALFSKYQINSHTHSGAKTQLSLHFVKTGNLEKEFGMLYGDLFDLRQKVIAQRSTLNAHVSTLYAHLSPHISNLSAHI